MPDTDPGPGARDASCGDRTYDGHDGIDLRLPSAVVRAGAPVLAPMSGKVVAVRDGEPDAAIRSGGHAPGRECGNGVLIRAVDGLEVQLCHLRQGSVQVHVGQAIEAGAPVGQVGQSGKAAFPHLHVSLRRSGVTLDPLSGKLLAETVCRPAALPMLAPELWDETARRSLPLAKASAIADWGFLAAAPARPQDADLATPHPGDRSSPALVFFAMFARPEAGDRLVLELVGPRGEVLARGEHVQERAQAQMARFIGRKTPPGGWPVGRYRARALLKRGGVALEEHEARLDLQ